MMEQRWISKPKNEERVFLISSLASLLALSVRLFLTRKPDLFLTGGRFQWSTDLTVPQPPFVELKPVNYTFQCCFEWTYLLLCAIYNLFEHALTNIFCDLIIAITDSLNDFSCWICLLLSNSVLLVLTYCSNSTTSKICCGGCISQSR